MKILGTPVGGLALEANDAGLAAVRFLPNDDDAEEAPIEVSVYRSLAADRHVDAATRWLEEYFENPGALPAAPLPRLAPAGTPFQQRVWRALLAIGYGRTVSYGDLCATLGKPGAARAVGQANGRNPLAIVVPCHRVIAATGTIGGYSAGLPRKRWLLRHEGWGRPTQETLALRGLRSAGAQKTRQLRLAGVGDVD